MSEPLSRRSVLRSLPLAGAALLPQAPAGSSALPAPHPPSSGDRQALLTYFAAKAPLLLRPAAGVLRFPSISPSLPKAQYSTELWDWDTLWTAQGLFTVARLTGDSGLRDRIAEHVRGCLDNFFGHQSPAGRIPMLISVTDSDPLGCLKGGRPHKENQAKPVLAQLALLLANQTGNAQFFAPHLPALIRFYDSWTADNLSPTGLLVWGDDVAIGNDNDPTTFGRPFFSSANLLLNCLYFKDLQAAAELARRLSRTDEHDRFTTAATRLSEAIQKHCWDARDRFFYTADVQCLDRRAELIPNIPRGMDMSWSSIPLRIQTFTGFLPMWCSIATPQQCAALVSHLENPHTFAAAHGIRSLSAAESMYSLVTSTNPSNWLGPIWIIVNYLVWHCLRANGFTRQAAALAARTVNLLARDLHTTGTLNEYYHPDTGRPLSHPGFMDWNLLALEMMSPQ